MADNNIKVLADRPDIVAIANAVRSKTGKSNEMTLGEIVSGINGISTGSTEDLDSVITELETKVATLNTTLDGKASGGGGGVETCTVILHFDSDARYFAHSFSTLGEDGKVTTIHTDIGRAESNITVTLENIICGSFFQIMWDGISKAVPYPDEIENLDDSTYALWKAPTVANSTVEMYLYGDD